MVDQNGERRWSFNCCSGCVVIAVVVVIAIAAAWLFRPGIMGWRWLKAAETWREFWNERPKRFDHHHDEPPAPSPAVPADEPPAPKPKKRFPFLNGESSDDRNAAIVGRF